MTEYLTVEQLLAIHQAQIETFGGTSGIRGAGALNAAAGRPAMNFGGEDLYPDLAAKAAALMHLLVMSHPFLDGNKRVAAMAAELFVELNAHELAASDRDLVEVAFSAARGEISAEALAIWFRQRLVRREI